MNPDNTVAPEPFPCKIGYIDGMTVHESSHKALGDIPARDAAVDSGHRIRLGNNRYHVPRDLAQKKRKARRAAQKVQRKSK